MKKINIILIILLLSTEISHTKTSEESLNSQQALVEFDYYLEEIENKIRLNKFKDACFLSVKASKIIEKNFNQLKDIEPYYHWEEINKSLIKLTEQNC
tara:strand:- start:21 stop:314 length:294 start_codon:yes stop_codon:yes gene_type:complete